MPKVNGKLCWAKWRGGRPSESEGSNSYATCGEGRRSGTQRMTYGEWPERSGGGGQLFMSARHGAAATERRRRMGLAEHGDDVSSDVKVLFRKRGDVWPVASVSGPLSRWANRRCFFLKRSRANAKDEGSRSWVYEM